MRKIQIPKISHTHLDKLLQNRHTTAPGTYRVTLHNTPDPMRVITYCRENDIEYESIS